MTKAELEQQLLRRQVLNQELVERNTELEQAIQALYRKIGELVVALDVARAR